MIKSGQCFYLGSSTNISRRKCDHLGKLRLKKHPNRNLQAAFDASGEFHFVTLETIKRKPNEDSKAFSDRLKSAEQKLIKEWKWSDDMCNEYLNPWGPGKGHGKGRKMPPEVRSAISERNRNISDETRSKMSAAKIGSRNAKSRPIRVITPDGSEISFESVSSAAAFFGVKQQVMDLWVRGVMAWPGSSRKTRKKNLWIAEYKLVAT